MPNDEFDQLLEISRDAEKRRVEQTLKYDYFLMAIAASCVAFSISETRQASISVEMIPLGLAVLCWAYSFYAGCRRQHFLLAGMTYFGFFVTNLLETPRNCGKSRESDSEVNLEACNRKARRLYPYQFGFLIAGGVFFLVWHILTMSLRTAGILTTYPS